MSSEQSESISKNFIKYKELITQIKSIPSNLDNDNKPTQTSRRGNSMSVSLNFPNLNEFKKTKLTQGVQIGENKRINLKKDLLKLYDKNSLDKENDLIQKLIINKTKDNFFKHSYNQSTEFIPNKNILIKQSSSLLKMRKESIDMNNVTKTSFVIQSQRNSEKNIHMNLYNDMAKQLKIGKNIIRKEEETVDIKDKTIKVLNKKLKSNFNNDNSSYSNYDSLAHKSTERKSSLALTKTTKDTSINFSTIKGRSNITKCENKLSIINPIEIEGPEDLHFFYVEIFKNNKKLAYKFDRNCKNESESNEIV